ncbi:unnamed protein product [Phytomonas sp. EM1]|nr:unnamed protein product [Phytomonas sp. EM1]|eukprot:CCW65111.1 unnamed protein product [Phytomonas sp. isolate EM1]
MNPPYISHPAYMDRYYTPVAPTVSTKPCLSTNSCADPRSTAALETYYQPPYCHSVNYSRQEMMLTTPRMASPNCEDGSSAGGFIGGFNTSNVNTSSDFHFPVVPPPAPLPLSMQLGGGRPFYSQAFAMPPTPSPNSHSAQTYPRDFYASQPEYNAIQQAGMYSYLQQNRSQMMLPVGGGTYMPFPGQSVIGHETNADGGNVSDAAATVSSNKTEAKKNSETTEGSDAYVTQKGSREVEVTNRDANLEDKSSTNGASATASKAEGCVNIIVATMGTNSVDNYQNPTFQKHLHGHCYTEAYPHHHHRTTYNGLALREAEAEGHEDTPPSVTEASDGRLSGLTRSIVMTSNSIQNHPPAVSSDQVAELPNSKPPIELHGTTTPGTTATYPPKDVSSSTSTPIGVAYHEHQVAREGTPRNSQQRHPPVPISSSLEISTEEERRSQDRPPHLVTEPLFEVAPSLPSGHLTVVNSAGRETEGGSKPVTANTTPVRHPPCYTNAMDRYWHSFPPSHILALDAGAFPTSASTGSPQGLPINYEPPMHGPLSSHQSPMMHGVSGARTLKSNSPYSLLNTPHSYREEICISRQACGQLQKKGPGAVATVASTGARSQPPPFGAVVGGEGGSSAAAFPHSPTTVDGCVSFNSPCCGHMDTDTLGAVSGYPMPVTAFAGTNKRSYNSNVPQQQQQQRYPQQYSYPQPQPTQCSFQTLKTPVLGIPSQGERGGVSHLNGNYRNQRGGPQLCIAPKMPDHFVYSGAAVSPMTGTGSHLQPNQTSDINSNANTASSARFPMPGGNYPHHVHTASHPQKQRGNSNYGYPSGVPPLLYEYHIAPTQETWIEEMEADASFDPAVYGNIVCLVNAFSPRVPVVYDLESPFQDDINSSSQRLESMSSSDSIPSISSSIHGDINKVAHQNLTNTLHGHTEAANGAMPVPKTESQCANDINSPIKNVSKQAMHGNQYRISHSRNTDMESSSNGSCPIPPFTSVKDVGSSVNTGGVVDLDAVPLVRQYQDFEGVYFVEPIVSLASVWNSFNYPFGCLVPLSQVVILSNMRPPESKVVYTPLLSGFRIRFHDASAAYAKLLALQRQESNEKTNIKEGLNSLPSSPNGVISSSSPGLLTWSASERPDNRNGVVEQVEELARANEAFRTLLTATTADIDHQSWVAIMWQPVFCGGHTAKQSCGTFLAFYMLRAPRHIFVPFADKSAATCMNSSWDSPVFRVDHEMLSFDIWGFERRYYVGRCTNPSFSATIGSEARQPSVPQEVVSLVNPIENEGVEARNSMDPARDSPQSASGGGGLGRETRRPFVGDGVSDFNYGPDLLDPHATNKQVLASSSTRQVRLPLIGLIFNRSRSDVWLCPSMIPPAEAMPGPGSLPLPGPQRTYRAPLFLLVSALQLMCWNAFEEDRRLKRFDLQREGEYDKVEDSRQSELLRSSVANTAYGEDGNQMATTLGEKDEGGERTDRKRHMDASTDVTTTNYTQVEGRTSRDQSLYPVDTSHNETTHNDGDPISSNSQSERVSLQKEFGKRAPSPHHVAMPPYYTKGTELLVNAARNYRNLREAAMIDSNAEEAAGYNHASVNSHTGASVGGCEPNKEPLADGDGRVSGHSDLPLRVVSGGTNVELCGSSGSVILGLLDFYQWAQYDASITDLAERYCMDPGWREGIHRRIGRQLEPR